VPFFAGVTGQVHYRTWSAADPRARLVFLHGMGQHSGQDHRFGRAMGRFGIEVWALDHVGHGLSEGELGEPGPVADLGVNASRLADLVVAETPHAPLFLMGHSLGASAAMVAVVGGGGPFAGLVLCGTPKGISARSDGKVPADPPMLALPVLVVHGTDDRLAPVEPLRAWVAAQRGSDGIEFYEYADAGHDLLHEPVAPVVTADVAQWMLAR
jgi:alpha-beta hydrolase superfamily lysophospholipase